MQPEAFDDTVTYYTIDMWIYLSPKKQIKTVKNLEVRMKLSKSWLLFIIASSAISLGTPPTPVDNTILDFIKNSPEAVLIHTYNTLTKYETKGKKDELEKKMKEDFEGTLNALRTELELECPLFLLKECDDYALAQPLPFGSPCILSRAYNKKYRKAFEDKVVENLSSQIQSIKDRPVNYTGFASGGMFQDLVILTKTLAQHPTANVSINLIDAQYRIVATHKPVLLKIRDFIKKLITKKQLTQDTLIQNQSSQFISWLQKMYPQAQLSLNLHASTQDYCQYLDKNALQYPDIIAAADIQDDSCMIHQAIENLVQLCNKTQYQNKACLDTLLMHRGDEAYLANLKKDNSVNMREASDEDIEIKLEDGSTKKFTASLEKI
jgi:hypothetical protein